MRYILDSEGYIHSVSCSHIECDTTGTEYTGAVPEGYDSLEIWATTANIRAYKIVDGNLVYDANRAAELEAEWAECKSGHSIISATLTSNYKITATNTYAQIPLNKYLKIGNKLTFTTDGKIKVGSGVTKVMVSGEFQLAGDGLTKGAKNFAIRKNNTVVARSMFYISSAVNTTKSLAPRLIEASENDIIDIAYYGTTGETIGYDPWTYLTVEVIE